MGGRGIHLCSFFWRARVAIFVSGLIAPPVLLRVCTCVKNLLFLAGICPPPPFPMNDRDCPRFFKVNCVVLVLEPPGDPGGWRFFIISICKRACVYTVRARVRVLCVSVDGGVLLIWKNKLCCVSSVLCLLARPNSSPAADGGALAGFSKMKRQLATIESILLPTPCCS